jgi:hypothetical protein
MHLQLIPELAHDQCDQAVRDGTQAPAVLGQKALPAAEIALVEEGAAR